MNKLAFLLAAACLSGSVLAADAVLFRDDFSGNAGWPASEKPETTTFSVADGRLRLANLSTGMSMQTSREVRVPGPAAYRLEFTTREIAASGDNVYYGVALRAPDGDEVGFTLGSEGYARIYYWRDNAWADAAMDWVQVPAMKTGAGALNKVRIERESGAFSFYVNDVFVGRSRIIDIAPSVVTVVANQQVTVDFDDIVLTRTGIDSRLARLAAQAPVPGAPVLAHDDFTRTLKEKLRGNTLKKDERWELEDSANTRRLIDYTRELMMFDRKADKGYSWVWIGGTQGEPRVFATYTVSAKVRYTKNGTGCGGVVLFGKGLEGKEYPMLLACIQPSTGNVQLWTYPQDNSDWTGHLDVPTKALHEGMNELRLVYDKGDVLVFINGEYQGNGKPPASWAYYGMGLYADDGVGMEVDDFDAREL